MTKHEVSFMLSLHQYYLAVIALVFLLPNCSIAQDQQVFPLPETLSLPPSSFPSKHQTLRPVPFNLETAVGSQKSTRALGAPRTIQKCLITHKVTTNFLISPCTPIRDASFLRPTAVSRFNTPPQQVSIPDLLRNGQDYHQQLVSVRGLITQPELHLDETELYLDFVFRLSQGNHFIVVYGRHDRTRSAPSIIINHSVEVIGTFWQEQDRKGSLLFNVLEAFSVTPHPSAIPGNT